MALDNERARVAHLLRRAGFGPSEQELNEYTQLGFDGAVSRLVNYETQPLVPDRVAPEEVGLQVWWLDKMVHTARPLQEKMTLFWHGHLTSALRKVKDPNLLQAQNELFRANALGNYGEILRAISRDGAMIRWLDLQTNRKGAPNENYARELMELFTLGVGNYTEDDVDEVARAFTGWSATPDGQFVFRRMQHDFDQKTILGQTGPFDGDDVSDMLAASPTTARYMARKLFRYFAYPDPEPEVVGRLADVYLASSGSIKSVVEAILRSPEFSSDRAYRALIKSPTELIVGALRTLGADAVPPQAVQAMRLLGQELFNPPNVAGWFGNRSWINAATLLGRFNVLGAVAQQLGGPVMGGQPVTALLDGSTTSAARVQRVLDLLVDGEASQEERDALVAYADQAKGPQQLRGLFRLTMALPAYQLN
ncbi:MAG TPA: DUF1800 domain-containing protein [Chloroflexota bacterium]|nr:DUF1800 domain-containing protein [Chloroflexota bacterium]